jgi:diacylglycerol kinase family enzyme
MPRSARGRVIVAANPYSGRGPTRRRVDMLMAGLRERNLDAHAVWNPDERATVLAGAAHDTTVVAVGGDGTVAAVINELAAGATLAVLAAGNENLFARALGFPDDPLAVARAVAAGVTCTLDLGRATSTVGGRLRARLFGLMLSVGFDADVVHRLARWRAHGAGLRRVGRSSYVQPLARALLEYRHPTLSISADEGTITAAWCLVSNVPAYPCGLCLTAGGRADDGRLDWVVVERAGVGALARYAWAARGGRLRPCPGTRAGTAARLRIDSETPVPVQVDGDAWGTTPVTIDTVPGALKVLSCRPPSRGE